MFSIYHFFYNNFKILMGFFRNKNKWETINSQGVMYVMLIIFVFKMIEHLIDSGEWKKFVVCIVICAIIYYLLKYIERIRKERSAVLPKKYRNKYPIIPQYLPPKNLNPAEAGLLYNCKIDVTDLTSLIYQWAFDKLISIKNIKLDEGGQQLYKIELCKLRDIEDNRPFFEKEIFNSIFLNKNKKIITNSFELRYALILEDLEYHGIGKGWVVRSGTGKFMGIVYNFLIAMLLFIGYLYFSGGFVNYSWMIFLLVILLLACILVGGYVDGGKLKLTDKGAKLAAYTIGYRNFIKSCDENIIKLYLKEDPLFIDKTLPYATAFGLETEFLNKVTPLAGDWKAQYVNGQKVSPLMSVIANIFSASNKKTFDIFYHW